jgi:hypothetical protein
VQKVNVDGQVVTLIALHAIVQRLGVRGKTPGGDVTYEVEARAPHSASNPRV